jgi:uncharacterized protein (TIGR02145 family)
LHRRTDGSGLVDIYYDISGNANFYFIVIDVSFNAGSTYSNIHFAYLDGDMGPVTSGNNKHVVWKAVQNFPNQNTTNAKIRITANPSYLNNLGTPCPGIPSISYGGQTYNTILIGNQCWLKENLNIGQMIDNVFSQTDNGVIEKYCYGNNPMNCGIYGGLYVWNEAMQYTTQPGSQGICPSGWHIPTDDEWKILEGNVDNLYGVGDPIWDNTGWRGFDAGKMIKSTSGWSSSGNGVDAFGFSALPAGNRRQMARSRPGQLRLLLVFIGVQFDERLAPEPEQQPRRRGPGQQQQGKRV